MKEALLLQGTEATGRGWLTRLEMAPFRAWTGGPSVARNQLCVLGRVPCLLWAMALGSVVFETQGLLWEGGETANKVGSHPSIPLPSPPLLP